MSDQVRFRSPSEASGFTKMPNLVLQEPRLSHTAKILYLWLCFYARQQDHCWPGQDRLAGQLLCSARNVRLLLNRLNALGLVSWERPDRNKTNTYWIESVDESRVVPDRNSTSGRDRNSTSAHEEDSG